MPIKGTLIAPTEPTPQAIPEDATREEKRAIKKRNAEEKREFQTEKSAHPKRVEWVETNITRYSSFIKYGRKPELAAACDVRTASAESSGRSNNHPFSKQPEDVALYFNPSDYIKDIWAEGHLATEEAKILLEQIDGTSERTFELSQFLCKQEQLGHISYREHKLMREYSEPDKAEQVPHDIVEIRQTIMNGLLESGLPPADALRYAMEVEGNVTRDALDVPEPDAAEAEVAPELAPKSFKERILAKRSEVAKTPPQLG